MVHAALEVTTAQIDAYLKSNGLPPVSRDRYKSWRDLGLIGPADQRRRVGKPGSETWYPPRTELLVGALALHAEGTHDLEGLIETAYEHGQPMSMMGPALGRLLTRRAGRLRALHEQNVKRGQSSAVASLMQRRRAKTQIRAQHRSPASYLLAAILFGSIVHNDARRLEVNRAFVELLRPRLRLSAGTEESFARALLALSDEAGLDAVTTRLRDKDLARELDSCMERVQRSIRDVRKAGALGVSPSWFTYFLLVYVAFYVSPSLSCALTSPGPLGSSDIERVAGVIRSAPVRGLFESRDNIDPRSPLHAAFDTRPVDPLTAYAVRKQTRKQPKRDDLS